MKKIIVKSSSEHAEGLGLCCPVCGSSDISGDSVEIENGSAFQDMFCDDCESSWTDQYQLTGYSNLIEGGNRDEKDE